MIYYFMNGMKNGLVLFLNDVQLYSKECKLPIIVPTSIQNNKKDDVDLSQLTTSWIYKIITTIPLSHAHVNLNKSLLSSALKSLFISDKSKTTIFYALHAIVVFNNNLITYEENINIFLNIVIETF